uniref:Uncharacterized protein n=1 Tax=Clastoptera arizonana TaxID=38151 RepID=A0A1B6DHQ8_9HEMI
MEKRSDTSKSTIMKKISDIEQNITSYFKRIDFIKKQLNTSHIPEIKRFYSFIIATDTLHSKHIAFLLLQINKHLSNVPGNEHIFGARFFHHDNAQAHLAFPISQFFNKNGMTLILQLHFFMLHRLKKNMKGKCFDTCGRKSKSLARLSLELKPKLTVYKVVHTRYNFYIKSHPTRE